MKTILLLLCAISVNSLLFAQTSNRIQPKIMVIPRVPEGMDMKAFYDSSTNIQIAIAKINESFQKRGANLRSFDQALKQAKENMSINKASSNTDDFKSTVLQMSGADIYVEAALDITNHSNRGNAKSVNVILDAYQTGTANSLATKTAPGPMFQTDDIGRLVMMAMDTVSEGFLNLLQTRFTEITENGQSVYVEFTISPNSKYTFDSEVGTDGNLLSLVVDDWFASHAVNGSFNNQGAVGNKLIISDVHIPFKNPANPNQNYTGQNFYADILKFFKTLNIPIKREISTNNKILITIQ